jgi:hypothetical protein
VSSEKPLSIQNMYLLIHSFVYCSSITHLCACVFVYLWQPEQFFSYPAAVTITITGDRAANLDLCLALTAFRSESSFSYQHLLQYGTSVYTV